MKRGFMRRVAESRGLRLTPQRRAILEVLQSTDIHPDAAWIYQEVRKKLPSISLGTVYRNLSLMAAAGLIRELTLNAQLSRWDGRLSPHDHVVCLHCHRVADIELPGLAAELDKRAACASGFVIQGHNLCFAGLCPSCRADSSALDEPV